MDRAGSRSTSDQQGAAAEVAGVAEAAPRGGRVRSVGFLLRVAGVCLIAGSVLWQPLLAAEHLGHLERRSARWAWYADQTGFLLAMVLVLAGLVALDRARVAGEHRVGRWALHGLVLGWFLLVVAQLGSLGFAWRAADAMTGVGGLLTYPTVVLAGAAAVGAGRLTGWRRWTLLGEAVYQLALILVPLLLGAGGPGWAAEAGWQLCWLVVGVAAVQQPGPSPALDPARRAG